MYPVHRMDTINPQSVYAKYRQHEMGNPCVHVALDIMGYTIDLPPDGYKHAYNYTLYPLLKKMGFKQTRCTGKRNLRHMYLMGQIPEYCVISVRDHMFCVKQGVAYDHGHPWRKFPLQIWEHPDMASKAEAKREFYRTLLDQWQKESERGRKNMEAWLPPDSLDYIKHSMIDNKHDVFYQIWVYDEDRTYRKKVFAAVPIDAQKYIVQLSGKNYTDFVHEEL